MVDIPSLTALGTAPADDDLLVLHDISEASSKDKKITVANLLSSAAKTSSDAAFNDLTINDLSAVDITATTVETGELAFTGGADISHCFTVSASLDLSSIAATTTKVVTATVTGAATGDLVVMSATSAIPDELTIQAYVSAANTVTVRAYNPLGTTITGASYTFRILVMRFQ